MRGMYTDKIIDLIAQRPGIRSVEIADKIDCEVEAVENSIRDQIESGFIRREIILAPNGRPTRAFWMKDAPLVASDPKPKAPEVVVSVPAPVVAPLVEVPPEPLAPVNEPMAPAQEAMPAPAAKILAARKSPAVVATRTKVDICMEFIRNQPDHTATDDDFRALLGLRKDQHPSVYLSTQRRKALIHKDIDVWRLGPRKSAADQPAAHVKPQAVEEPAAVEFRCALWSDGELQLARGEQIAMRLTAAEVGQLRNYLRIAA